MAPPTTGNRNREIDDSAFQRVEELFHAACQMSPVKREQFLQAECESDSLRSEVVALLRCDDLRGDAFDDDCLSLQQGVVQSREARESFFATLKPGEVLGDYSIEKEIGRGGMAIVFRARQISLDRTVALKVLPLPFTTEAIRERFRREALAGGRLHHEHIVTVYEYAERQGVHFYAMELVEGQTLDQLLREEECTANLPEQETPAPRERITYERACRWAADAACGLAHAHVHGVIHRDIKPSNLIVTQEGRAKILDFGVAKLQPESNLTTTGTIIGTPRYMSPEQISSVDHEVDHRADIYSLGATLYQLLTLHPPFEGDDFGQLMNAICNNDPIPLRHWDRRIPADLEAICLQAMAKEPADRYQRAEELASDLENFLEGRPISVKSPGLLSHFARTLRRSRQQAALATTIVLCIAAVTALLWRPRVPVRLKLADQRHITSDRGFNADPSLSADGRWLVFASDRRGKGDSDIWMQELNEDGSKKGDPLQITSDPGDETEPALSPDGKLIAYCVSGTNRGIYTRQVEEGRQVSEARQLCDYGRGPRFSPDGNWIAYWVGSIGRMLTERGESIWVVSATGGTPRQLCPEFSAVAYPVWSPDGRKILFCGGPPTGTTEETYAGWWITPIDKGDPVPIDILPLLRDQGIEWQSLCVPWCWTPHSNFVIFSGLLNERFKLWSVPLDPDTASIGELQQLTTGGSQEFYARVAANNRICFAALEYDYGLWSESVDASRAVITGPLTPVADNPAMETAPSVTADGNLLVFNSDRGGDADIYIVHGNSPATRLVGGKGHQSYAMISADGDKVAYLELVTQASGTVGHLLYVAALNGLQVDASNKRILGENLGMPFAWHPSSPSRFLMVGKNGSLQLVDTQTGEVRSLLENPAYWISSASFSPDGQWIAFSANSRIFVAPVELGAAVSASWIPITDGAGGDRVPDWSSDGNTIYFMSDRDGRPCVWSQTLDPTTKHATGTPREVHHFPEYRRSPVSVGAHLRPLKVAKNRLFFCLGNYSGNILVADVETE